MRTLNFERTLASLFVLMMAAARGQAEPPVAGLYRIISGTYSECCGFVAVPVDYTLPRTNQCYVELAVDGQGTSARIAFLGDDLHTVFQTAPAGPGTGFTFFFTNGAVLSDQVRFDSPLQVPENPNWSYTVSTSAGGLVIQGIADSWSCCDFPTRFWHTNVVAVPLSPDSQPVCTSPRLSPGGAFQFTVGNGRGGQTNVIEASANLTNWTAINTNVFPATACPDCPFIEFEDPDSPRSFLRRFYRSHSLP